MEACEFAEDFVNRHPGVGFTLAAAYTSDKGFKWIHPSSCSGDNHIVKTSAQVAHKHVDLVKIPQLASVAFLRWTEKRQHKKGKKPQAG